MTMKQIIIFSACLFFCAFKVGAQFSDTIQYHAKVASTGNINRANEGDTYLMNNSLKFDIRKKALVLNAGAGWIYGQQNNNLTNNDFTGALDFNVYKALPHMYYWGLTNYTASYSLKINSQAQTGVGLAYNVIDKKNYKVNLSDGILYESSDIVVNDNTNDVYQTFRNSFRLAFKLNYKDIVLLDGTNFLQSSLSDGNDYIIKSNINLSFKVRKWLSLTTSFTYNKFSRTNRENMLFSYGFVFEKYF